MQQLQGVGRVSSALAFPPLTFLSLAWGFAVACSQDGCSISSLLFVGQAGKRRKERKMDKGERHVGERRACVTRANTFLNSLADFF